MTIPGANSSIRDSRVLALARFGAQVAVCDRDAEGSSSTVGAIEAAGRRLPAGMVDVRDEDAAGAFMAEVGERFGAVDLHVNNTGGGFWSPILDVSAKDDHALIRENFTSVTTVLRHTVLMSDDGSIIDVTCIEAHRAGPGFAICSVMKAAVANLSFSFSFSLSMELAPRRIRVNCIAPDMSTPGDQRPGEASAAVDLPSDLSRFVTGSGHVDGGTWAARGWKAKKSGGFTL